MEKWVYTQILLIVWSFYLLSIHLSSKDHMFMKLLLFLWFFTIAYLSGRKFKVSSGLRLFFIFLTYSGIYFGHVWFQRWYM
ncbi:MAG: hypothetical protein H0Z32_03005 [Bacillaceae bacterium]|nr:hypothetical protein [Bacillaceae bacterium]